METAQKQAGEKFEYDRIPYMIVFQEQAKYKDTYAGRMDFVGLEAHLLRPKNRPAKTVIVFMHPIGGGAYLPMVSALAKKGYHVIYCNSRYRGVDSALIMEKVVLDLNACIKDAKSRWGYEKVVLAGWSGGGSLSLFFQSQAEKPTVECTPAGDSPDLTRAGLEPAQGMMLLAAHISRAGTLTEWMDASIIDETDPFKRDRSLDIYDPEQPEKPPYSAAFVQRYREAQIARNRRITAWVKQRLEDYRKQGMLYDEFAFVVHGTMADPRFLDVTLDPNDRPAGWCYLGDPRQVNNGPVGLARFNTLRSWLSQWSYDDSNADGLKAAANIRVPVLVIGNTADDACTPSHTYRLYEAVSHDNKVLHEIKGANHYYFGQPDKMEEAANRCSEWLQGQGFAD